MQTPPNETCIFEERLLAESAKDVIRQHDPMKPHLGYEECKRWGNVNDP